VGRLPALVIGATERFGVAGAPPAFSGRTAAVSHDGRSIRRDGGTNVTRKTRVIIAAAAVGSALAIGTGVVVATSVGADDGPGHPITGPALEQASSVALAHIGEGRVTATEVDDEEGYYEVEVTRDDGSQVDVHLTEDFTIIDARNDGTGDESGDQGE
jgi:hypothetical protein